MPGNFPVNRTNLITPIVFQAIIDVIKKKIVMIIQMNKLAVSILFVLIYFFPFSTPRRRPPSFIKDTMFLHNCSKNGQIVQ